MTSSPKQIRRPPRVPCGADIVFKPRRNDNLQGVVRDLSEGGILLESLESLTAGTEMVLYLPLDLQTKKTLCIVSGKVVRIDERRRLSGRKGYGVAFDRDLSASSRRMLRDFVVLQRTGVAPDDTPRGRRVSAFKD